MATMTKLNALRMMAQSQLERAQAERQQYLEMIRHEAVWQQEGNGGGTSALYDLVQRLADADACIEVAKAQLHVVDALA